MDPSGPLATLRKLLLSDESLATFRRWIVEHWYAAALIVLAAISVLVRVLSILILIPISVLHIRVVFRVQQYSLLLHYQLSLRQKPRRRVKSKSEENRNQITHVSTATGY